MVSDICDNQKKWGKLDVYFVRDRQIGRVLRYWLNYEFFPPQKWKEHEPKDGPTWNVLKSDQSQLTSK